MSVRSHAPASAGAGRGTNLDRVSGMSGFDVDVEGLFSLWERKTGVTLYHHILPPYKKRTLLS